MQSLKKSTAAYTLGGKLVDENDPLVLAKAVVTDAGRNRWLIKVARSGMDAGHLFNPQSPTASVEQLTRVESTLGRGRYEFREVPEESFEAYVRFLKTMNNCDYRYAERTMI